MSVLQALMDRAKEAQHLTTDTALAERLGRSRQVVSQWRKEDAYPDEELIAQMATMAGEDPAQWLVAIKAVRSDGAAGRAWTALARKLAASAAMLLCAIGMTLPGTAKADIPSSQGINPEGNAYYVKMEASPWQVQALETCPIAR
jgi:transcriptional regulator with XRE-family HTH domain